MWKLPSPVTGSAHDYKYRLAYGLFLELIAVAAPALAAQVVEA